MGNCFEKYNVTRYKELLFPFIVDVRSIRKKKVKRNGRIGEENEVLKE